MLTLVAFLALVGRLAWMQGVEAEHWRSMSEGQVFREIQTPAPRGNILDRNGTVLATSQGVWAALLAYTQVPPSQASIRLLGSILNLDPAGIEKAIQQQRSARGIPYQPIRLKLGLNARELTLLYEYLGQLPGVQVAIEPVRVYPGAPGDPLVGGTLAANVLGYVQRDPNQDPREAPQLVGISGLEKSMNRYLEGKPGVKLVQVDPAGRPVQTFSSTPPVPGDTLVLTLDAHVQDVAQRSLAEQVQKLNQGPAPAGCDGIRAHCYPQRAAAVVVDVRTGAIIAMASYPTFDPNVWARLASNMVDPAHSPEARLRDQWMGDDTAQVLTDHTRQTPRSPGSTFKPVTGMAALANHLVTPEERIYDPGYLIFGRTADGRPNYLHNWSYPAAGGWMNMVQALARSDNVYFWTLGERLHWQQLADMAHQFGMGVPSGLRELPTVEGTVETPAAFAKTHPKEPWTQGLMLNAAIGQGDNQFTPLEMAQMAAIIANGGTRYRPYIVSEIRSPDGRVVKKTEPEVLGRVDAPAADFQVIRQGMLAVNSYNPYFSGTSPVGLAYGVFGDFPQKALATIGRRIEVAGKTGTTTLGSGLGVPDGWYIGFAPYDRPEVAVAVWIEHGNGGAAAAAPVARKILEAYFHMDQAPAQVASAGPAATPGGAGTAVAPAVPPAFSTRPGGGSGASVASRTATGGSRSQPAPVQHSSPPSPSSTAPGGGTSNEGARPPGETGPPSTGSEPPASSGGGPGGTNTGSSPSTGAAGALPGSDGR